MSGLSAEQRGDLVEAVMPEAAGLVVDVHEGSADDIRTRLAGLSRHELEALAVVLAALADPDRQLKEALAWVDFDEHGNHVAPSHAGTRSEKAVRDLAPQMRRDLAGVDVVAVNRALSADSRGVGLNRQERRLAIEVGNRRGLPTKVIAERLGMTAEAADLAWQRIRKRAREEGRPVPSRPAQSLAIVA